MLDHDSVEADLEDLTDNKKASKKKKKKVTKKVLHCDENVLFPNSRYFLVSDTYGKYFANQIATCTHSEAIKTQVQTEAEK